MTALRTVLLVATAAGLTLFAACTSGTTADCSPDAGGNPNASAWCGVPAGGDAGGQTAESGPAETGAGDTGVGEGGSDGGPPETGSPEAAADAPSGG